ncbi:MAG: ABC transporter ATP-binding protein [Candidatus Heimdallarchaeota archaeon]|nr:ABC transporter ATP-binding protein [Candidatus Heimdallarchaeota archaeon]MCG3256013.1 ABC transporter ATP-binding protein [Candidatus Heimdallarchaeota archaeon]MCK4611083.1 ABC transporter ATP-binding protein [Candidatus Heimdallarchaeota archaeon]
MAIESEYVIETQDLVKIYKTGKVKAVDGLNLKIKKGEIYALIGANGSGKTTSLNMISGALFPTSGNIRVLGYNVPKHRRIISNYIGIAPQDYSIFYDLSLEENVRFFSRIYGMTKAEFEPRFNELLNILRLEEKRKALAKNLSGGMKRRTSIACALIHNPRIVFFDEATVGIDPVLRTFFWKYFHSLKEDGITLVITSHVMDEAERADRIGLMRGGKLIAEGTPSELRNKHNADSIEEIFIKLSEGVIIDE